jgi:hypothetical protein
MNFCYLYDERKKLIRSNFYLFKFMSIFRLNLKLGSYIFFEDTFMQVIQVIILLVVLIMLMRYCGFDDMLFCCIYIDKCY